MPSKHDKPAELDKAEKTSGELPSINFRHTCTFNNN